MYSVYIYIYIMNDLSLQTLLYRLAQAKEEVLSESRKSSAQSSAEGPGVATEALDGLANSFALCSGDLVAIRPVDPT